MKTTTNPESEVMDINRAMWVFISNDREEWKAVKAMADRYGWERMPNGSNVRAVSMHTLARNLKSRYRYDLDSVTQTVNDMASHLLVAAFSHLDWKQLAQRILEQINDTDDA